MEKENEIEEKKMQAWHSILDTFSNFNKSLYLAMLNKKIPLVSTEVGTLKFHVFLNEVSISQEIRVSELGNDTLKEVIKLIESFGLNYKLEAKDNKIVISTWLNQYIGEA